MRLLLTGIFSIFFAGNVFACSCLEKNYPEAFETAGIVFVGSVTQFEVVGTPEVVDFDNRNVLAFRGGRKATFRIQKVWKGPHEETISIFTGEGGGDCGFDFVVGHEYLVYASEIEGQWKTGICTRTRDVWFSDWSEAQEDFEFLKGYEHGKHIIETNTDSQP